MKRSGKVFFILIIIGLVIGIIFEDHFPLNEKHPEFFWFLISICVYLIVLLIDAKIDALFGKVYSEISDLKFELNDLKSEIKSDIANLHIQIWYIVRHRGILPDENEDRV